MSVATLNVTDSLILPKATTCKHYGDCCLFFEDGILKIARKGVEYVLRTLPDEFPPSDGFIEDAFAEVSENRKKRSTHPTKVDRSTLKISSSDNWFDVVTRVCSEVDRIHKALVLYCDSEEMTSKLSLMLRTRYPKYKLTLLTNHRIVLTK